MVTQPSDVEWALLSYRMPREPSTPRIAVWRRLKTLGVAQLGDGLVALPDDARSREHLEWIAAAVLEAGGEATVWVARTARRASDSLATHMRADRNAEYSELLDEISRVPTPVDNRTLHRLRNTLRRIERRDFFRAPLRDRARLAVDQLAGARSDQSIGDPT